VRLREVGVRSRQTSPRYKVNKIDRKYRFLLPAKLDSVRRVSSSGEPPWRYARQTDLAVECVRGFLEVTAEDPEESASIDLIRGL